MFRKQKFIKKVEQDTKVSDPRMFRSVNERPAISQTVTVIVNEKDDGVAECLAGCFSACFGLGKKAATS